MSKRAWWTEEQIEDALMARCEPLADRRGWKIERQVKISGRSRVDVLITTPKRIHVIEVKVTADSYAWDQLRRYVTEFNSSPDTDRETRGHIVARFMDFSVYLPSLMDRYSLWRAHEHGLDIGFSKEPHPLTEDQHLNLFWKAQA